MFRTVKEHVWAFDLEWIPDPMAGRLLHKLPEKMSDREVMMVMWDDANPTPENPMPFLRTILCRVVSIAAVVRKVKPGGEVKLDLLALPRDTADVEQAKEANLTTGNCAGNRGSSLLQAARKAVGGQRLFYTRKRMEH